MPTEYKEYETRRKQSEKESRRNFPDNHEYGMGFLTDEPDIITDSSSRTSLATIWDQNHESYMNESELAAESNIYEFDAAIYVP